VGYATGHVNDRRSEESKKKRTRSADLYASISLFAADRDLKIVLRTDSIRIVSPGARVGQAWENVRRVMNGTPPYSAEASSE
jgi:hypothetical protein